MRTLALFGLPEFVALFILGIAYTIDTTKLKPARWKVRNKSSL